MQKTQVAWLIGGLSAAAFIVLGFFFILGLIRYEVRKKDYIPPASVVPASKWERFTSKEGRFSIRFPGIPESTNVTLPFPGNVSGNGEISGPLFFVWADKQTEYAVNYFDYPPSFEKLDPQKQFDTAEAGIARELGKIEYQQDFQYRNNPGREFEFVAGGKANYSGRIRYVRANHRFYSIEVLFLTQNPHPDDFKLFFSSFSLPEQLPNSP